MAITTSLLRLHVNCKDHGNEFYKKLDCKTCQFLLEYHREMARIGVELDAINSQLELALKEGRITTVEIRNRIATVAL